MHRTPGFVDPSEPIERWKRENSAMLEQIRLISGEKWARSSIPRVLSEQLYGVSRVIDLLLFAHQGALFESNDRPQRNHLPPFALTLFADALGASTFTESTYEPWMHEVVRVENTLTHNDRVRVTAGVWPGLMIGSLLLVREGVCVAADESVMNAPIAEQSALYWAHQRLHRQSVDLSSLRPSTLGWHTPFRRDYATDTTFFYNVDAGFDIPHDFTPDEVNATEEQLTSLVINRMSLNHDFGSEVMVWKSSARTRRR